jgi:hypothetical protein
MTAFVILADDANTAASRLAATGQKVRKAGDVTRTQLAKARKVIVVWSRSARGSPALRAAAQQAKARGKLVCVRLDAALPPAELGGQRAVRLPPGPLQDVAWRRLMNPVRRPITAPTRLVKTRPSTRRATRRRANAAPPSPARTAHVSATPRQGARLLASLAALALIVLAAGAEAYARDADFAARVKAFASDATARASQVVAEMAR